jgi:hypothetical protein
MCSDEVHGYLCECHWFIDYTRTYLQVCPEDFVSHLVEEMERHGAAGWIDDKLTALTTGRARPGDWFPAKTMPRNWYAWGS